jgi:hypothetical protein
VAWSQYVNDSIGSQGLTLSTSGLQIQDYNADGTPNFFNYDLWNATVDVSRPWFLVVNGSVQPANATWFTNGWQWQGGSAPSWQTLNFTLPSGAGSWAYVTQGTGSWYLNYTGQSGYIEDYWNDGSGTPNFFYYDVYSATVDVNRPFTLNVWGTTLDPGTTTFYGDWAWQGGSRFNNFTLSLSLNGDRASHNFTVTAPDGTTWPWNPTGSLEAQTATFTEAWSPSPGEWTLGYSVLPTSWSATCAGSNGQWTLTDTTTGDSQNFNPSHAGAYWLDASQWWLPAQSFDGLRISLSRWSHDLRIRQRDHTETGGDYLVDKLSSQGSVSFTPEGAWYEDYAYFDATSHLRMVPGMDWWLYDATTGEYATPDGESSFINWIYTPKPVNLAAVQSAITGAEITWELPAICGTEMLRGSFTIARSDIPQIPDPVPAADFRAGQGTNPLLFHYTPSGLDPGTYTYTITYSFGGQTSESATVTVTVNDEATLATMDSDGDGFTDLDEIQAGTNPYDANSKPLPLPVPVTLGGVQSGLAAVELTWAFPGTCGPEWLQGTFTIVRTNTSNGQSAILPEGQPIPAATCRVDQDAAPLRFLYTDSGLALAPGTTYAYAICYSDGHRTSPNANVTVTVNDEATLATMYSDGDDFSDLEEFQSGTNPYDASSSPPARIVAKGADYTVLGGKKLFFDLESENGIGDVSYAIASVEPTTPALATVTLNGKEVTVKSKTLPGGTLTIHFTASDGRNTPGSSSTGTVTIEIEANPLKAGGAVGVIYLDNPQPVTVAVSASGGEVTETANYTYNMTSDMTKLPKHGSVSGFSNQQFYPDDVRGSADITYSPDEDFPEEGDSFEVEVTDTKGTKKFATVVLTAFQQNQPDGVSIGFGPDMQGVVGDVIPSILTTGGKGHFVSPKKTTAIPAENVVLTGLVTSAEGKTFEELYEWFVDGGSWGTSSTLYLPRSAADKMTVVIKKQVGGTVMAEMYVWIVWAEMASGYPVEGKGVFDPDPHARWRIENEKDDASTRNPFKFKWNIAPSEIFDRDQSDVPNLNDVADTQPPGASKNHPVQTDRPADSAEKKWDVSRKMQVTVRNPQLISKNQLMQTIGNLADGQPSATAVIPWDFPKDSETGGNADAAGNDDSNSEDENDDPYSAYTDPSNGASLSHSKGQVTSMDAPGFKALAHWATDDGMSYRVDINFKEFVRLELKTWFRISDETEWYYALRVKSSTVVKSGVPTVIWENDESTSGLGSYRDPDDD